jgi:hypothetical protein
MARLVVFIAVALVLNHARCVAACVARPCVEAQQPSCHHHQSPDTKADRGCAFPAANDARAVVIAQDAVPQEPVTIALIVLPAAAVPVEDIPRGSPPGVESISVLRI